MTSDHVQAFVDRVEKMLDLIPSTGGFFDAGASIAASLTTRRLVGFTGASYPHLNPVVHAAIEAHATYPLTVAGEARALCV